MKRGFLWGLRPQTLRCSRGAVFFGAAPPDPAMLQRSGFLRGCAPRPCDAPEEQFSSGLRPKPLRCSRGAVFFGAAPPDPAMLQRSGFLRGCALKPCDAPEERFSSGLCPKPCDAPEERFSSGLCPQTPALLRPQIPAWAMALNTGRYAAEPSADAVATAAEANAARRRIWFSSSSRSWIAAYSGSLVRPYDWRCRKRSNGLAICAV
jgi:hypothetical protein